MKAVLDTEIAETQHFTASEWAEKTGLPYGQILRAAKRGELKAIRFGTHTTSPWYISAENFRAWLDSLTVEVPEPNEIISGKKRKKFDPADYMI